MANIKYTETNQVDIDAIKPLWEKLNEHIRVRSPYFKRHYETFTFDRRKAELLRKADKGLMHICLASDIDTGKIIGYCISTIIKEVDETEGEIDSIFVDSSYRSAGIGDSLMKKALAWMDALGTSKKRISVGVGNESVFTFYERYGFYPRMTMLQQIKK